MLSLYNKQVGVSACQAVHRWQEGLGAIGAAGKNLHVLPRRVRCACCSNVSFLNRPSTLQIVTIPLSGLFR